MKPSYKHFFVPFGEVTSTTPLHDNPILPSLTRSSPIGETPNLVDGYKSGPETMLGQIRIGYRQPYNKPAALPPRKPSYPSATCSSAIPRQLPSTFVCLFVINLVQQKPLSISTSTSLHFQGLTSIQTNGYCYVRLASDSV